ncbi:MAG: hypothetical protein HUJ68_12480 [Clostridia bacterium]|nr:hypothetical protein [Clostridia bacterium]
MDIRNYENMSKEALIKELLRRDKLAYKNYLHKKLFDGSGGYVDSLKTTISQIGKCVLDKNIDGLNTISEKLKEASDTIDEYKNILEKELKDGNSDNFEMDS